MRSNINFVTKRVYNPGIVKCNPCYTFMLLTVHLYLNIRIKYYRYYISLLRVTQTANLPCLIVSTFVLIVRKSGYNMSCSDARLTLMQVKMPFKTKPTNRIDQQFELLKTCRLRATF